ncbi:MAG TPA: ComEC/Rec2 family competence protein, partial [Synergistaceae bacterium]|nr:ComEC/Rec2 family competence protein [Synergistaceae bacterium]
MRLRWWVMTGVFLLLAAGLAFRAVPPPEPEGGGAGVFTGRVTSVSARGAMIGNLWVSSGELGFRLDRGDSLLVLGARRGRFITPWGIRFRPDPGFFPSLRRSLVNRLRRSVPDTLALGLSSALLMGNRGMVPAGAADSFRRSGTAHLLALSGMHTGMVAGFILLLSRFIFGRRPLGSLFAGAGVVFFVLVTGAGPSTV